MIIEVLIGIAVIIILGIITGKILKSIGKDLRATDEDLKEEEDLPDLPKLKLHKLPELPELPKVPKKKVHRFKVRTIDNEFIYAVPCHDPGKGVLRLRNLFVIENKIILRSIFKIEDQNN